MNCIMIFDSIRFDSIRSSNRASLSTLTKLSQSSSSFKSTYHIEVSVDNIANINGNKNDLLKNLISNI